MQQQTQHITSVQVADRFGMRESLEDIIIVRHLRWLGHVVRIEDHNYHLLKQMMFGCLSQPRPAHGVMMRWRDHVKKDLKKFGIAKEGWFKRA